MTLAQHTEATSSDDTVDVRPEPSPSAGVAARDFVVGCAQELVQLRADAKRRVRSLWAATTHRISEESTHWWSPVAVRHRPSSSDHDRPRRTRRWSEVLAMGLVMFGLWLVLDAPALQRSAQGAPFGARRSVALAVLGPVSDVSHRLGLASVIDTAERVLGRHGDEVVSAPPPTGGTRLRHGAPSTDSTGPAADALAPLPRPSAATPLRVLEVGDSLGVDFGGPLVDALAATHVVDAVSDARIDTGLSRPDYFDWPAELQADMARYHPQVVVVFLGANDPQNFVDGGRALAYGSAAWAQAYAQRVGSFMAEITTAGARVIWVGMPPMAVGSLDHDVEALDSIYQTEASAYPGVTYLSSWTVLGTAQGSYAEYLPDASGAEVAVREPDGIHVSPSGASLLASAVITEMNRSSGLTLGS